MARHVLHREVPGGVVADRIDGDEIVVSELGVVVFQATQDHRVTGSGRQELVDLRAHSSFRHTLHRGSRWNPLTPVIAADGPTAGSITGWGWIMVVLPGCSARAGPPCYLLLVRHRHGHMSERALRYLLDFCGTWRYFRHTPSGHPRFPVSTQGA